MPRLFLGNFDFEHRLADPKFVPSDRLKRLNAELASSWLAIADDGDYVWTPSSWDPEFIGITSREGLPQVIPVTSFADVPRGVVCVPWGWSHEIRELTQRFGWSGNAPDDAAVRIANSRQMSDELERKWNVGLSGAARIGCLNDLEQAIQSLQGSNPAWVVKAEFSMSARERILGNGPLKPADTNWVRRRLIANGVLFFEPWVERIDELGIQIEIPSEAAPKLIGVTPMLVDSRGQYAGSWISSEDGRFDSSRPLRSAAVETALRAAEHLQQIGYFGPLGIDAMIYRDPDGSEKVRPLQDINARWTMGRLSLGWARLLGPNEAAVWQHGPADDQLGSAEFQSRTIVETSPKSVGGIACQHRSRLLIR